MVESHLFLYVEFSISLITLFYIVCSFVIGHRIKIEYRDLFTKISIFCAVGLAGEIVVNNAYAFLFGTPLWEYYVYPIHHGDTSLYFLFIWGELAVYKYICEQVFVAKKWFQSTHSAFLMSAEAVAVEVLYNGLFYALFGTYIFYYLPANLGPISHFSCLQVIPCYFFFGIVATKLYRLEITEGSKRIRLIFYWFIIVALIL